MAANPNGALELVKISHKSFRNIGLIGRPEKAAVVETLCLIYDHLLKLGLHPIFDVETAKLVPYQNCQIVSRNLMGKWQIWLSLSVVMVLYCMLHAHW
jgi:NAD+ kinase